jgi:hypothetical protein
VSVLKLSERTEDHLIIKSVPKKVWNPVFSVGVITFVASMLLRGFLDAGLAVFPLALSTLILFSGIWILSANGLVVFDKQESNCYFIFKHLGYLQKIYTYPLTSIDRVLLNRSGGKQVLTLYKDDGNVVKLADSGNEDQLIFIGDELSEFLQIPFER